MNAMEKLVALWPKGSEWKLEINDLDYLVFTLTSDVISFHTLCGKFTDADNAGARNIIEDALIELGYRFLSWSFDYEENVNVFGYGPKLSAQGFGATRTEALLDLAVKVLEAQKPPSGGETDEVACAPHP